MSSTRRDGPSLTADRVEECSECERETPHDVTVEVRAESDSTFSREPYRVTECTVCRTETTTRLNNV